MWEGGGGWGRAPIGKHAVSLAVAMEITVQHNLPLTHHSTRKYLCKHTSTDMWESDHYTYHEDNNQLYKHITATHTLVW